MLAAHGHGAVFSSISFCKCQVMWNYTSPEVGFGSRESGNCLAGSQWLEDLEAYGVVPFQEEELLAFSCWVYN